MRSLPLYVFDIDGTLTLVGDRVKFLLQSPKDWDSYFSACYEDEPNAPIVEIYRTLQEVGNMVLLTGRRESCRQDTETWMYDHGLSFKALLMRPNDSHEHDTKLKPRMLSDYLGDKQVNAIFEDRNSVVAKWRELGFTCLHVAEGDF